MAEIIKVELSEDHSRFRIYGGSPTGKDQVHTTVCRWPGWSRAPIAATLKEGDGHRVSVYSARVSPVSTLSLAATTMRVEWGDGARQAVEGILESLRIARRCLETKVKLNPHDFSLRQPMPHQSQAVAAIGWLGGRVLLADDMGLGKTSTALWAAQGLEATRILVICPASVKFNWRNEVQATLGWPTYVIDGTSKRRATILAEANHKLDNFNSPFCIVINYDLLITLNEAATAFLRRFVKGQALICDESHYLKSRKAARTKFVMRELAPPSMFRMLLSGTPIRNMADDLWSQIEIIRPGTWTSYWDFAKRHLEMRLVQFTPGQPINKIVGTKDLKGLNAVVNTVQIRRIKEDVLDLPPKIHTYPELELVGDHLRVYKAMKQLAVLELDKLLETPRKKLDANLGRGDITHRVEEEITIWSPQARSAVLAALRCEQIAMGFCGGVPEPLVEQLAKILSKKAEPIPGRPREIIFPDSPKLVWLTENLETLFRTGKRPVVFSRFNAPLHWLYAHYVGLGKKVGFLHGNIASKHKHQVVIDFQDGNSDLLLVQVKMAEGFNLHISQDCIFLGRDWSPAVNHQAKDRLHRIGQKGTVNIQIPIVRNTIEKLIHKKLMAKDSDAQQALKTVTIKELKEAL